MAIRLARLTLLAFPQSWEGGSLVVRFLCLPKGDPEAAPAAGLPPFSTANLIFNARLIGSLDELPLTADSTPTGPLALKDPPVDKAGLFAELATHFTIVAPGRREAEARVPQVVDEELRGDHRQPPAVAVPQRRGRVPVRAARRRRIPNRRRQNPRLIRSRGAGSSRSRCASRRSPRRSG